MKCTHTFYLFTQIPTRESSPSSTRSGSTESSSEEDTEEDDVDTEEEDSRQEEDTVASHSMSSSNESSSNDGVGSDMSSLSTSEVLTSSDESSSSYDGDRELQLVRTSPGVNGSLLSLFFRLTPPYLIYNDFFVDLRRGLLNEIIEEYKTRRYTHMRLLMKIKSSRLTEGTRVTSEFHSGTKTHPLRDPELIDHLIVNLQESIEAKDRAESNWSNEGLEDIEIQFIRSSIPIAPTKRVKKGYGNFTPLPKEIRGNSFLLNYNTGINCVETAIMAHFYHHKLDKNQNQDRQARQLARFYGKETYSKFPKSLTTPVSLHELKNYEKEFDINICVYQLTKEKKGYSIHAIRKGGNRSVPSSHHVYLVAIEDTNHVVCVKNGCIQKFIQNLKGARFSDQQMLGFSFCVNCLQRVQNEDADRHRLVCIEGEEVRRLDYPKEGETYDFRKYYALGKAPYAAAFDFESLLKPLKDGEGIKNAVHRHDGLAFSYVIVDKNDEIKKIRTESGKNRKKLVKSFVNHLLKDHNDLYNTKSETWNPKPEMSYAESVKFDNQRTCEHCSVYFEKSKDKHCHHDWNKTVIRDAQKRVIVGNYVSALCFRCNSSMTEKVRALPVFSHNGTRYDNNFILSAIEDNLVVRERKCQSGLVSRAGDNFIQIMVEDEHAPKKDRLCLKFLDSYNFLPSSLNTLVESLKANNEVLANGENPLKLFSEGMKMAGYRDESLIKLVSQKCFFPYEHISDFSVLSETSLPPKEAFYSTLTNKSISDSDYQFSKQVFEKAKCKSLKDYMHLYLQVDVFLLLEIIIRFRSVCIEKYKLDPFFMLTTPSLAMESALYAKKHKIDLIANTELITEIKKNVKGGFTSVIIGHMKMNDRHLPGFDENKPEITCSLTDVNSLYGALMSYKLPHGGLYVLTPNEIQEFARNWRDIDREGDYCYLIRFKYNIPDEVKRATDDLPLFFSKEPVDIDNLSDFTKNIAEACDYKFSKAKSLLASHTGNEYFTTLGNLQLYEKLGVEILEIESVFRFDQDYIFREFITKNVKMRNSSKSAFEKVLYKLFSNSIFGKLLFNAEKNAITTHLVTSEKKFQKMAVNPLLKDCYSIDNKKVIMKMNQKKIKLNHPQYIGFVILEEAKRFMHDLFYLKIKKAHPQTRCAYHDTDSLLLVFENLNIVDELRKKDNKFQEFFDTSNFLKEGDSTRKGVLGLLKSETGDTRIKEFICLQPKCYSILLEDETTKTATKGVKKSEKLNLTYSNFERVHNSVVKEIIVDASNIIARRGEIFTVKSRKRAFCKVERKRYWIDKVNSLAFGHPDIPSNPSKKRKLSDNIENTSNLRHVKQQKNSELDDKPRETNLTYHITRNVDFNNPKL